jgi:Fe-S cluster biogenesis protein NfuA
MIPFSDEELRPVVEKSLEKVKPMLELDGGGMKLLDIKGVKYLCNFKGLV